ncbi:hypothetical protein [Bacillus horti]|uniref:Uncharacterized protein n=1 Tax=Caldalkalibacillus horti TaxID=77523 RepID=A0ABT9W5J3_9BACI|nr:hypothetical protein [Bacillus horti]MDQ0168523.1 hypothetical protein [Bacillus horti]
MKKERFKVSITCKNCGERFILRGNRGGKGTIETGFKQCLCNNVEDFNIQTEELEQA